MEFAFALLFLFLFIGIFFEFVGIFLTHERVSYANFAFSRLYSVHRVSEANSALNTIDSSVSVTISEASSQSASITCSKFIHLPVNLYNFSRRGGLDYKVTKEWHTFMEPQLGGDN